MTTVNINDEYIHVFGHSNYAPVGFDIVCASLSTLIESLYRYLKRTGNTVDYREDDGEFIIYLDNINEIGKGIIDEYSKMIDEIIKDYSRYVRRIYEKVRKPRKICKSTRY